MIDVATGGACSKSANVPDATHNYPPSAGPVKEEVSRASLVLPVFLYSTDLTFAVTNRSQGTSLQ